MSRRIYRTAFRVALALVALVIVLGALGTYTARHSFPQTRGSIRAPGLHAPVEVDRDAHGIPQIYAADIHDLMFAQGYVHAQDRFWQMDFWRHVGAARLSELFGKSQLKTDKFLRTLGWARVAETELKSLDPESVAVLQAYADGVNAYLADHRGTALSLEYGVLALLTPGYQPEPWTPVNSLTWTKAMAWDLGGNMDLEIQRAVLTAQFGADRVADLYPGYPADHPLIVPPVGNGTLPSPGQVAAGPAPSAEAILSSLHEEIANLNAVVGGGLEGIGSNNWVVAGSHTTTGAALLANDMHLGLRIPSIWYQNGLHCEPVTAQCPYTVTGFSFPSLPGVVVGHNDQIAWGVTNFGPDVQDLYLEHINPQNPNQYEVDGAWVDMTLVQETLRVAGGDPVPLTVRYTRHGPIVSDVDTDLASWAQSQATGAAGPFAVSLRWTALDPCTIFESAQRLDLAQNWDEFRSALSLWDVPGQNFVYADRQGNIGYQATGRVPIRASGDGRLPTPGWTDAYEWTGYIPFEKLPTAFNPAQGFLATANNAAVGADYPYLLSSDWDYGYRAARIVSLLQEKPKLSAADLERIHGDDYNAMGVRLVPLLLGLKYEDNALAKNAQLLAGWDFQNSMNSAPAALFNAFWRHLLLRTFGDQLPPEWIPEGSQAFAVIDHLVDVPASPWWDDVTTTQVESRDDIFRLALSDAVVELRGRLGNDPASWTWGALHTTTFENESLGRSGVAPIEALFNRGPFPTAGGGAIVNATGWDADKGYQALTGPSERMIVDLGDFDRSLAIHTTGQSGHAYNPHYIDMADPWRLIQYFPMPWTRGAVQAGSPDHLTLAP